MKILIADKLAPTTVSQLKNLNCTLDVQPDLSADDIPNHVQDADVLIVRSTRVTKATIDAGQNLALVIRAGAGVNTIDLESCSQRGIHVANCPGKNTDAVAELAIGHLINADRRIVSATEDLKKGDWNKKEYGKSAGLKGRTLGIIGFGQIGKAVAKRALGLEMKVIATSRSLTPETAKEFGVGYAADIFELAKQADAISIHLAAKPETKKIINDKFLSQLKDGAILVNTSRGQVVDEEALLKAIQSKQLRVGLDVFDPEPEGGKAEFLQTQLANHVMGATPHVGASTDQSSDAIAAEVVCIVKQYKETGKPLHVVNIQHKSKSICNLVVRHYNKVGVLASVLDALKAADVNVEEMENIIFDQGAAASCTLQLDAKPADDVIQIIKQNAHIIQASLKLA